MPRYAVVDAPSILGLRPGGVERLPDALRAAGLIERLGAEEVSDTGEVADMDLALATGRGPAILADLDGLGPLVADQDVVVLGYRHAEAGRRWDAFERRAGAARQDAARAGGILGRDEWREADRDGHRNQDHAGDRRS